MRLSKNSYLHSNMVRFIILSSRCLYKNKYIIYIPIWLDLLFVLVLFFAPTRRHLHSNMVRFIIKKWRSESSRQSVIYIPIWLDLLLF